MKRSINDFCRQCGNGCPNGAKVECKTVAIALASEHITLETEDDRHIEENQGGIKNE